jgi:hypothetical protein
VGVKLSPSNRFYGMFDSDGPCDSSATSSALSTRCAVAYLHLMEPNAGDLATGTVQIEHVAETFRPAITVPLIANGSFDRQKAQAALDAGTADLVSFGVPFVANPDLPRRFEQDAPLNTPDPQRSTVRDPRATPTIRRSTPRPGGGVTGARSFAADPSAWVDRYFADVDTLDPAAILAWYVDERPSFRFASAPPTVGKPAITAMFGEFFSTLTGMSHARTGFWSDARSCGLRSGRNLRRGRPLGDAALRLDPSPR